MKNRIVVERKYLTEDARTEVYLEEVTENGREKLYLILKKVMEAMYLVYAGILITIPFAVFLCCLAYMERGYQGYGGEWVLVMIIFLVIIKIVEHLRKG